MKIENFRRVNNSKMNVNVHFPRNCMSHLIDALSANDISISSLILDFCHVAIYHVEQASVSRIFYLNVIGSNSFLSEQPSEDSECFFKIQTNKGHDYHTCEITLYVR